MFAVQLHKLGLHQLSGVIIPGNTNGLAGGTNGFQHQIDDFVKLRPVNGIVLNEIVILDILQKDFSINLNQYNKSTVDLPEKNMI